MRTRYKLNGTPDRRSPSIEVLNTARKIIKTEPDTSDYRIWQLTGLNRQIIKELRKEVKNDKSALRNS